MFVVGDRVQMADADEPNSIPAYQQMCGEVVEVKGNSVRVAWDEIIR